MTSGEEKAGGSVNRIPLRPLPIVVCPECDLLQRKVLLSRGEAARCRRCGAVLYRSFSQSLDRTAALLFAAAIVFLIANANPIVLLEAQGIQNSTTMFGAVRALMNQGMPIVSLLVFFTAVLAPALEIGAMIYLILPLRNGHVPVGFSLIFRIVHAIKHWNMVEVFMLALLVALVKLSMFADVVPALALWSYAVFTVLLTAAWTCFDPHEIWNCADAAGVREPLP